MCQNGEDVAGLVASLRGPLDCGATAHTLGDSSCRAAGGEETECPCRSGHDSEQQSLVPCSAKELCEHQDGHKDGTVETMQLYQHKGRSKTTACFPWSFRGGTGCCGLGRDGVLPKVGSSCESHPLTAMHPVWCVVRALPQQRRWRFGQTISGWHTAGEMFLFPSHCAIPLSRSPVPSCGCLVINTYKPVALEAITRRLEE